MKIYAKKTFESLLEAVEQANHAAEETTIFLEEGAVCHACRTLEIRAKVPVILEGEGACLSGEGGGTGILIRSGDVTVRNFSFMHFFIGIGIEADGGDVSGVTIENCRFEDVTSEGITTAVRTSDTSLEYLTVRGCTFEAPSKTRGGHCSTAISLITASYESDREPLENVALKHVLLEGNHLSQNREDGNLFMLGITAHGACAHTFYLEEGDMRVVSMNRVEGSLQEDLVIRGNTVDGVFDIGIDVIGGLPGRFSSVLRDVVIEENTVGYHNTAINVGSTNIPCNGDVHDCVAENIMIRRNRVFPCVPGPHEPQIGIMVFTIRAESQTICCTDCRMTNVTVEDNEITGREVGIALQAAHATQDLPYPSRLENILLRGVTIRNNTIRSAQLPLRFWATHLEGRYDPFWGFPLPDFDNALPFSTRCEHVLMDDVTVENNTIEYYDIALTMGAAWACGHAFVRDSVVGENMRFSGNKLDKKEKVYAYRDVIVHAQPYEDAVCTDCVVLCRSKMA